VLLLFDFGLQGLHLWQHDAAATASCPWPSTVLLPLSLLLLPAALLLSAAVPHVLRHQSGGSSSDSGWCGRWLLRG